MKQIFLPAVLMSLVGCSMTTVSDRVPELNAGQKFRYAMTLNLSTDALDRITGGPSKTAFLDNLEKKLATIKIERRADGDAKWQEDVRTAELIQQMQREIKYERTH